MKKVITYCCDHCGYEYATKEEAAVCERNHKLKLSIIDFVHYSIDDEPDGYPRRVELTGEDGKHVWYTREQ